MQTPRDFHFPTNFVHCMGQAHVRVVELLGVLLEQQHWFGGFLLRLLLLLFRLRRLFLMLQLLGQPLFSLFS